MLDGSTIIDFSALYAVLALVALAVFLIERRWRLSGRFAGGRTRVTVEGMIFGVLACVVLAAAINTRINLLYLIAGVMFSAIVASLLLARSLMKVTVTRIAPSLVEAGGEVAVRLSLSNGRRFRTLFALVVEDSAGPVEQGTPPVELPAVSVPMLEPANTRSVSYRCRFPHRGVYRFGRVVVKSRFPFGFIEVQQRVELPQEIVVHPAIGKVRGLPMNYHPHYEPAVVSHRETSGEEEFSHLRDYRPDDNPRRIHWRTSARLRELHVMEVQSSPSRAAEVVFDAALADSSPEHRERFEKAAGFAATIVSHLADGGYHLSFSFNGASGISGSAGVVLPAVLDVLARVRPQLGRSGQHYDVNANGGFRIVIRAEGRCRSGPGGFVAAAADPEIDRWYDGLSQGALRQSGTGIIAQERVLPKIDQQQIIEEVNQV